MTTNAASITRPNLGTGAVYQWTLAPGDDGVPCEEFTHADRSVQVTGISGHTVTLQGSNDGVTYVTLTDPLGNPLSFTSDGLRAIAECTRYARPAASGGSGNVVVSVFARRAP